MYWLLGLVLELELGGPAGAGEYRMPNPTTFEAVMGWERRRGADRSNLEGVGPRE